MAKTAAIVLPLLTGFYFLQSYLYRPGIEDETSEKLRQKTASLQVLKSLRISQETIQSAGELQRLYKSNSYTPFWFYDRFAGTQARALFEGVKSAGNDGLNPRDYHVEVIQNWIQSIEKGIGKKNPDSLALLDILLTDAFVTYASHQYAGSVFGSGMNVHRNAHLKKINLKDSLLAAVPNNKVKQILSGFINTTEPYRELRQKLAFYKRIDNKGGFPTVPYLKPDSSNSKEVFRMLSQRLAISGELPEGYSANNFSPFLQAAAKQFQLSHGLDTNGELTRQTIDQLNIPVDVRIRQIELNIERWRWLPQNPADTFVLVNIPGFFMEVQEKYKTRLKMRAIVGKEFTQTPQFYADMRHVVINPYWDVPFSIASKEILPVLKKDPGYIQRSHMKVFTPNGVEIDPYAVNWTSYSTSYFPYKIRQLPGPWNSLGEIKFLFPNPYNVYLHGTPHPELFEKNVRTFSHGCMRIEDPVTFAMYLLGNQEGWNEGHIRTTIQTREETWIRLSTKIPVFVTYATCWVDDNGVLHFRNDVYGHDDVLAKELLNPGEKYPS